MYRFSNSIITILIILILIFQDIFEKYLGILKYFDEFISVVFLIYMLFYILKKQKIDKHYLIIIICTFILTVVGLISNYKSQIQINLFPILMDIFNIFKFIPALLGGLLFFQKANNKEYIFDKLSKIIGFIIIIAFLFGIVNLFYNVNMYTDIRFGFRSYNFLFTRVGDLYIACFNILLILTADLYFNGYRRSRIVYIFLTLIVMCLTLRSRAFIFAGIYLFMYLIFTKKKRIKFKLPYMILAAIVLLILAYPQINFYFIQGGSTQARSLLIKGGVETATRYFPWGSGFATYGTYASKLYYSSLYYDYGFDQVYGLGRVHSDFLNDNYWPSIIAQFGFLATFLMIKIIMEIFKLLQKRAYENNYYQFILFYGIGILAISSLVTSSFLTCINTMVILSLVFSKSDNIEGESERDKNDNIEGEFRRDI